MRGEQWEWECEQQRGDADGYWRRKRDAFCDVGIAGNAAEQLLGICGDEHHRGIGPITVTALGRIVAVSNGGSHVVKIVQASTGTDVPGAAVTVNVATGTPGTFAYATLSSPVTLSANTAYYVVTQETSRRRLLV